MEKYFPLFLPIYDPPKNEMSNLLRKFILLIYYSLVLFLSLFIYDDLNLYMYIIAF